MTGSGLGALVGLLVAVGILLVIAWAWSLRAPGLLERIAPYVPATATTRALLAPPPSAASVLMSLAQGVIRRPGRADGVSARLLRAGRSDVQRFRLEQIVAAAIGFVAGGAFGALTVAQGAPLLAILVLAAIGAVIGPLLIDWMLGAQARRRLARIGIQLPAVAELLAFSVAAGETPIAAIDRVAATMEGDLIDELRAAIGDIRGGVPLDLALRGVSERTGSAEVERFVDGLVVSMERGTPLADVLRAQAADARAAQRRALMEIAGRKDVAMLVPVVFFILPTVVLVALFPGLQSLRLVVP
jgi:tight adherence protein C